MCLSPRRHETGHRRVRCFQVQTHGASSCGASVPPLACGWWTGEDSIISILTAEGCCIILNRSPAARERWGCGPSPFIYGVLELGRSHYSGHVFGASPHCTDGSMDEQLLRLRCAFSSAAARVSDAATKTPPAVGPVGRQTKASKEPTAQGQGSAQGEPSVLDGVARGATAAEALAARGRSRTRRAKRLRPHGRMLLKRRQAVHTNSRRPSLRSPPQAALASPFGA